MKERHTGKASSSANRTDWARLRNMTDQEIRRGIRDDPDAVPTNTEFWKRAQVVLPQPKQTATIRLDADLLGWPRSQKGYQTRINAVLRTYMDAQRS